MILDDQIDQELLKRSVTIRDTTTVTGMLKGDGSAMSAGIPNLDYVPAISGDNTITLTAAGMDVTAPYLKLNGADVGGIADAPNDGKIYVRRNAAWEELVIS